MAETDPTEVLTACPSEQEAAMLLSELEEAGIEAQMSGALTSGFRAEAPGQVEVLVHHSDLERAQAVLGEQVDHQAASTSSRGPAGAMVWIVVVLLILALVFWGVSLVL